MNLIAATDSISQARSHSVSAPAPGRRNQCEGIQCPVKSSPSSEINLAREPRAWLYGFILVSAFREFWLGEREDRFLALNLNGQFASGLR